MTRETKKIRVGIIRADTHGFWYAHLFEKPDPRMMRKNHRGCHYYFYKRGDPEELRFPPVPGMTIAAVYDEEHPEEAAKLAEAMGGKARVCRRLDEVSDDVDLVYIADCSFEGKDHLRYATPGLKKGVPHFVDKPFAYTLKDALKMIALAQANNTAVMCASLLRYSPRLERFGKRLADVAPVRRVEIPGCGSSLAAVYHTVSAAQNVMTAGGYGRCQWVECVGAEPFDVMRLHYPAREGGTDVFLFNAMGHVPGRIVYSSTYHHCEVFLPSAYGDEGSMHSPRVGDYEYPVAGRKIVALAKKMAVTKRPPIDYATMLEPLQIIEAARVAQRTGTRVTIEPIRSL